MMPDDDGDAGDPVLPATLILVCCHAVYTGGPAGDPTDAANWLLQPFQRGSATKESEHLTFLRHIACALRFLCGAEGAGTGREEGERPLVVFSGGPTNSGAPHTSEARGYLDAAHGLVALSRGPRALHPAALGLDLRPLAGVDPSALPALTALEERATDTPQNALFGVCLFRRVRGAYPAAVRVVSHAFKRERILMHARALRWTRPLDVLGIDPRWDDAEARAVAALERRNALEHFRLDPYAARSPLADKRVARGWHDSALEAVAEGQDEIVCRLLRWSGGESGREVFPERLPWEEGASQ